MAVDEAAHLRARVAELEAELDRVQRASQEHGHTAEATLREAEALADALADRGRQLESAERRAGNASEHAARLAEQLLAAQRSAAGAQAERDAAVSEVCAGSPGQCVGLHGTGECHFGAPLLLLLCLLLLCSATRCSRRSRPRRGAANPRRASCRARRLGGGGVSFA